MRWVVGLLLASQATSWAAHAQAPEVGSPAPEFSLGTLDGNATSLSRYRGHAVVLNFWASWCEPCRAELPELASAYQANQSHGLVVLAINLTDQERRKDVNSFVGETDLPFPILLDQRGRVRERYGLVMVPTTLFIDSSGIVRRIHPGPITRGALEQGLATILGPVP